MSIDGFQQAFAAPYGGYSSSAADAFWSRIDTVSRWLGVEVKGTENVPSGRVVFVMNHAFGWDAMLPMAAIHQAKGRQVWALGEHLWWRIPFLRRAAAAVGTVDGTPEHVDELLQKDEAVLVLPGGLRESMKPRDLRYRLLWGRRFGFVRAALRNHAPLVPIAGIGADEVFDLVGDAFARGRRWIGREFPIPRPKWGLPILHFPHLKYVIGEPIDAKTGPDESEEHALRRIRREVRGALEELIDEELVSRALEPASNKRDDAQSLRNSSSWAIAERCSSRPQSRSTPI